MTIMLRHCVCVGCVCVSVCVCVCDHAGHVDDGSDVTAEDWQTVQTIAYGFYTCRQKGP